MKRAVESAFETLEKDETLLKDYPNIKDEKFKQLIDDIWSYPDQTQWGGSSLEDLIKMVAIHPKEMCTLLGLSNDYKKTYEDVVEDTQTAQALLQCEDITLPSQGFLWFFGGTSTRSIQYSIQVGDKKTILGTATKTTIEKQESYSISGKSDLCKLAWLWMNFSKEEDTGMKNPHSFIVHLNNRIADQASSTQSNSRPAIIELPT